MSELNEQWAHHSEDLVLQDLMSFHALVRPADLESAASLTRLASTRLRQSGVSLRHEAAWALLGRLFACVEEPSSEDESDDAKTDLPSCEETLLRFMAPLPDWLDYLERLPLGEVLASYRRARQAALLRWFPHVHPSRVHLQTFLNSHSALDPSFAAGIAAHVSGPYNCFPCRRTLAKLQPQGSQQRWAADTRLAAATEPVGDVEWRTSVQIANTDRSYAVRYLDDGGYLRVFIQAEENGAMPHTLFSMKVLFHGGQVLENTIRFPEQSFSGVNFGKLGRLRVEDVVGFSLRSIVAAT